MGRYGRTRKKRDDKNNPRLSRGYVVAAYRRFFEDDGNVEKFQKLVAKMALDPKYAMGIIRDMADRLDGKPTEMVEVKGESQAVRIVVLGGRTDPLKALKEAEDVDQSGT